MRPGDLTKDKETPVRPEIFVLAGPNGAGKTTIASVLLPEAIHLDRFVNADLLQEGYPPSRLNGAR